MAEWISVKDRLPEKDGIYLCCHSPVPNVDFNNLVFMSWFLLDVSKCYIDEEIRPGFVDWNDSDQDFYEAKLDYWMLLPEPPVDI